MCFSWFCYVGPYATAAVCNSTTYCEGPIEEMVSGVFPGSDGHVYIEASTVINNLGCSQAAGGPNIRLKSDHLRFEETYAAILLALGQNRVITIRIDETATECEIRYIRVR